MIKRTTVLSLSLGGFLQVFWLASVYYYLAGTVNLTNRLEAFSPLVIHDPLSKSLPVIAGLVCLVFAPLAALASAAVASRIFRKGCLLVLFSVQSALTLLALLLIGYELRSI